jgi:hypothetical protein
METESPINILISFFRVLHPFADSTEEGCCLLNSSLRWTNTIQVTTPAEVEILYQHKTTHIKLTIYL